MLGLLLGFVATPKMNAIDYSKVAETAVQAAIARFPKAKILPDQIGIALGRLDRDKAALVQGSFRGDAPMYPASVVKIFYVVALANRLHDGSLTLTPELDRAAHDMIVDSVNDATSLIVDTLTDTTSGPELATPEMAKWVDKRNSVNRWFQSFGFDDINACQKTWNEGPYGRDRAFYGQNYENRNRLTPNACVRLLTQIALDRAVPYGVGGDARWSEWMKGFLKRDLSLPKKDQNEQAAKFSGSVLPKGSLLWSKAGWTDSVRHDLAWVKLPDGREYLWAIFTKSHSDQERLIPFLASELLKGLKGDR